MKYNFKTWTETAKLPTLHTAKSAGLDFYADESAVVLAGRGKIISTGVSWAPEELEGFNIALIIQSRSGLAFKNAIEASNAGVIDEDYTPHGDEKAIIHVKLYNNSPSAFTVNVGDKIAQGVVQLVPRAEDVKILDCCRQGKGFGSSDSKEKKNG